MTNFAISRTLAVLQPGYIPWLGFFDQMKNSDVFVFYDDVSFDKHGWRNRNRIKSPRGPHWLTVPVKRKKLGEQILDVEIDNRLSWARKHIGTLKQFYSKTPYLNHYLPILEELLLGRNWKYIVDLDLTIIQCMCEWLGLKRELRRSSELNIQGERTERLVNLCLHFGATRYLSGPLAKDYLDIDRFAQHEIEVYWHEFEHPSYPQQYEGFVSHLSALDLLFNCGSESKNCLISNAYTAQRV